MWPPATPAPSSLIASTTSRREDRRAGARPKRTPVTTERPRAKRRARRSTPSSRPIGKSAAGTKARSIPEPQNAMHDAGGPGQEGEDQALGQELPHEAEARRAHRQPHGDLATAADRSSQEQVGHVRAGDEQDEAHRHPEDGEHGTEGLHRPLRALAEGEDGEPDALVRLGVLLGEARGQRFHLGAGLARGWLRERAGPARRASGGREPADGPLPPPSVAAWPWGPRRRRRGR